jgi:hypothetical protein
MNGETAMNKQNADERAVEEHAGVDVDRRTLLKMTGAGVATLGMMSVLDMPGALAQARSNGADNFYTSDRVTLQNRAVQFWFANGRDRAKRVLTRVEAAYKESTIWREYVNL